MLQDLQSDTVPSKYIKQKGSGKETTKPRKVRNQRVLDFVLHLTSHVVYGEGTLMLCFLLDPWAEDNSAFQGQALMVWNMNMCIVFSILYTADVVYLVSFPSGLGMRLGILVLNT